MKSLRQRPLDLIFVIFFVINLGFITYIVDLEQLVIDDPHRFDYPLWPPAALVDLVHWWGDNFDPLQNARPVWWKATSGRRAVSSSAHCVSGPSPARSASGSSPRWGS